MSMRYQAGILTASYFPLKVPNAPTAATATVASPTSVSVAFTAPANVGDGAVTSYLVVSSDGETVTGASSPITVTGLTTGTAYTFVVFAINAFGAGPASATSNSVTPAVIGQQAYTTAGTYSWVAPAGVTSVSVVAVGGGSGATSFNGGFGGGLGYKNNYAVTPGNSYSVVVGAGGVGGSGAPAGASGGNSFFVSTGTVRGGGPVIDTSGNPGTPGSYTGDGGGVGGVSGGGQSGGGAGGYSGNGGAGSQTGNGSAGAGGGGGGGAHGVVSGNFCGSSGGGVGILGQGANGAGGIGGNPMTNGGGKGGSGGGDGANARSGPGGAYGGGGSSWAGSTFYNGGGGAVRIIWPGTTRSFPSTNTGDL